MSAANAPRPYLAALLDAVAMRAVKVEVRVDTTLEQSVMARVELDRHGDAAATMTCYSADSASDALERALVAATAWANAQPVHRRPIVAVADPLPALVALLERCVAQVDDALARDVYAQLAIVKAQVLR